MSQLPMFSTPLRCTCAEDPSGLPCDYCIHLEKTMTPEERTARAEARREARRIEMQKLNKEDSHEQ